MKGAFLHIAVVAGLLFSPLLRGEDSLPAAQLEDGTTTTQSPWVPRDPRAEPFLAVSFSPQLNVNVPLDLEFMGADGMRTTLRDRVVPGKPIILAIVYYRCPTMCNFIINDMVMALADVPYVPGEDFTVLSVSFDAEETHVVAQGKKNGSLEMYGDFDTADGWQFMVGNEPEIVKLTRAVNFGYKFDPATGEYAHGSGLLILTPDGRLSRFLPGVGYQPRDLQLALVEAGEGKIGTLTDRIALLCYKYDPETGRYGLLINRVIIVACLITVAALAWMILGLLRLEKRRAQKEVPAHPPANPPSEQPT
ncbi:MAG: SCO family protein [Kiritimatiellae bacterium]|nr:SCO family protein [Kiritimatiellia bacterium]